MAYPTQAPAQAVLQGKVLQKEASGVSEVACVSHPRRRGSGGQAVARGDARLNQGEGQDALTGRVGHLGGGRVRGSWQRDMCGGQLYRRELRLVVPGAFNLLLEADVSGRGPGASARC
jgi:hypothetical protein